MSHLFNRSLLRLIHVVWFNNISFLFLSNSSFYSICNSCINWWIFGLLPVWGLLWVMRYIHSCTCLCVSIHFHFCWENIGRLHGWEQWASEGLCACCLAVLSSCTTLHPSDNIQDFQLFCAFISSCCFLPQSSLQTCKSRGSISML